MTYTESILTGLFVGIGGVMANWIGEAYIKPYFNKINEIKQHITNNIKQPRVINMLVDEKKIKNLVNMYYICMLVTILGIPFSFLQNNIYNMFCFGILLLFFHQENLYWKNILRNQTMREDNVPSNQ